MSASTAPSRNSAASDRIGVDLRARQPELEPQLHQPLLCSVVKVALQLPARVVRGLHDPRARGAHLGLRLLALGDVAHVAGEAGLIGEVDPGDRELDGKRRSVGAHPRELEPLVEHHRLAGLEVARQPHAVALAQLRRHDQLGQLAAHRLVRAVTEGGLGRGVELEDPAAVVDADHRVERDLQHRLVPCPGRAQVIGVPAPLHRLADLIAERGHHLEQLGIELARLARVELDHAQHAARAAEGEAEAGVQARPASGRRAREVRVVLDIRYPRRLARGPHAAGQSLAGRQAQAARDAHEVRVVHAGRAPRLHAHEHAGVTRRRLPGRAQSPAEPLADRGQRALERLLGIDRLGEAASHPVLRPWKRGHGPMIAPRAARCESAGRGLVLRIS